MITQVIWADVNNRELDNIYARVGDEEIREIQFIICRNDPPEKVAIPAGVSGQFRMIKSSGNFVVRNMTKTVKEDGTVIFTVAVSDQMVNVQGTGYYDIRLSGGGYLYTASGRFIVDTPVISSSVLEDVSEVNGLIFPDDFLTIEDHVAYIDNDTISTDSTWSSNKINEEIEAHTGVDVSKTVSGNPVIFTDGASAPLVKCVTEIQGLQDLHGYDKPWVGGAEKNILPMTVSEIKSANTSGTWSGNNYTVNDVTFSVITDNGDNVNGIKVTGTASAESIMYLGSCAVPAPIVASGCPSNGSDNTYYYVFYVGGWYTYNREYGEGKTFESGQVSNSAIVIANGYACPSSGLMFYPMLRASGTTADFAPYSNICPITAYTEGEIEVWGKNQLDNTATTTTINGVTFTVNADGTVVANGTATANTSFNVGSFTGRGNYKISGVYDGSVSSYYFQITNSEGTSQLGYFTDGDYDFEVTQDILIRIRVISGAVVNNVKFYPMLRLATETDPTYEPYTSTTHTTTYPSTIYRGSEDVVNGEVVTDWGMIASYAGETLPGEWISDRDEYAPGTTPTTGAQVAYELATPTTSSVTPTNLPIKSLSGYTHIESTTGDMEVEYITERFQPLIDSIKQL